MPIPLRMNPVPIVLKQLSVSSTPKDADFGEPKAGQNKIYGASLNLSAQVSYVKKDARETALTGDPGSTSGHLCFRKSDLDTAAVILKKGDIILSIAAFPVNYKVTEVRPSGHLRGRANLILALFAPNEETNPSMRR